MNVEIRKLLKTIAPDETFAERAGHAMQRVIYNWLRHNDDDEEPQTLCIDLVDEALMVVQRALENRGMLDGTAHARIGEVLILARARS
jgi:hypothetical protein